MKPGLVFGVSLLFAVSVHAVILLVPRVTGREERAAPTIEVSLAPVTAADDGADARPAGDRAAAAAGGAVRPAAPPAAGATPAPPAVAVAEPAPPREPQPVTAESPVTAAAPEAGPVASDPAGAVATTAAVAAPAAGGTGVTGGSAEGRGGDSAGVAGGSSSGGGQGGVGDGSASGGGRGGAGGGPAGSAGDPLASVPRPRGEILPEYPRSARREGWEGVVTIRVVIDKEGRVVSAGIFASSGHRTLDQAALEAVKRAPFDPGRQGATPVSSTGDVVVRFHLN